jgi:hypothetical protein
MPALALIVGLLVALLAACGDNGGELTDGPLAADGAAAADAVTCEPHAPEVPTVDLFSGWLDVTFDGIGTRCEQAVAAMPQLIDTWPGIDRLLASPGSVLVQCDDFESEVVLTFGPPPEIAGVPLIINPWSVQVFMFIPNGETFLSGQLLDVVEVPPPACLGDLELRLALPGHDVEFVALTNCFPSGGGTYTIAVGDAYTTGDPVLWVDPEPEFPFPPRIHRARHVEIRLLPSHVSEPIRFSDFNCCDDLSLVDCVGTRALVDVFTAEILVQSRLCEPTCAP